MLYKLKIIMLIGLLTLVACAEKEDIVEGIRLDLRPKAVSSSVASTNLKLPSVSVNSNWTQRNGSKSHHLKHPALSDKPRKIWSATIGVGNKKRLRISADPIVAENHIFTLDAAANITAFNNSGEKVWSLNLKLNKSSKDKVSGGGLAYASGMIAATTGSGEVILINASSGKIKWRHSALGTISAPPAFDGKKIIVMTGGKQAVALEASNGRIAWQQSSNTTGTGILGAGTPAISGNIVILPYSSGEVQGVSLDNGLQIWSHIISGKRRGSAAGYVKAVSGDPVVFNDVVYVGNGSGRLTAINITSGRPNWTIQEGTIGPVWLSGNALFLITDQQSLKRLDRKNGSEVWSVSLPIYKNAKRETGKFVHFSPVLAGNRIYVAGTDGLIRVFDPTTGSLINSISIKGKAASQVAVANEYMYVLSGSGKLIAFQ